MEINGDGIERNRGGQSNDEGLSLGVDGLCLLWMAVDKAKVIAVAGYGQD